VHSYYPDPADRRLIVGQTEYADCLFAAMVARSNLAAVQFHPERSGRMGLKMLGNFCRWEGGC
jgi:glutamine amidotransferase